MRRDRIAGLVISPAFTETLRRITDLVPVDITIPTEEGFSRLSDLIDSGEVDDETIEQAEESVRSDEELLRAIDEGAELLSKQRPFISRKLARQLLEWWVWLMWSMANVAIAVLTPPAVAAIPGALAAGYAAAKKVREELDKRCPEEDEPEE